MREVLTGLAIILIVALTTALVAPYLVDWNGQRAFLEAQLGRALGQKVTIGGNIDLKLLPTPFLRLSQTVVGSDDGPITIGIRHLDLELSVAPLLHGEIDIVEGRLDEPTIRVTLRPDRTLPALPDTPALRADVRFERIVVADGTLAIADPESGRTFVYDHLDFNAEAPSIAGPFKASGTEGDEATRSKFRISTSEAKAGRTRLHIAVDETPAHAGLDLDGTLTLTGSGADAVRQSFDGKVVANGHLWDVGSGAGEPLAWQLGGPLRADPQHATLGDGSLRIGGEDALTLDASGDATFGEEPRIDLALTAKQLDIDRLSGPPVDDKPRPPPQLPDLATLRRAFSAAAPPLPLSLDLTVDNAIWGGETLSGIEAHLSGSGSAQRVKFAVDGPGDSHVALETAPAGAAIPVSGTLAFSAGDLPGALRWLKSVDPASTIGPRDLPFRTVKMSGALQADDAGVSAKSLNLDLDRSTLSGSGRFSFGGDGREPKLALDLKAKALDLDAVPDLAMVRGQANPFDLDLVLDAAAIRVARFGGQGADGSGDGAGLATGRLALSLAKTGRTIVLRQFRADDLGGATLDASGTLDATHADIAVKLDARALDAAAALVGRLAPGAASDALQARAASLSPATATLAGVFAADAEGKLAPKTLALKAVLAGTKVEADLGPDAGGGFALTATAKAADGGRLLHQFGAATLPVDTLGASSASLTARGPLDAPLETSLRMVLGGTRFDVDGRFALFARGGSGTMHLRSPDLTPLVQTLAIAFPDLLGRLPADVDGGLAIGQTGIALSELRGHVAGTAVTGTLKWQDGAGTGPSLTGSLDLDQLSLAALLGLSLGPTRAAPANAAWSDAPFTAGLIDPPRSELTMHAKTLEITPGLVAEDAAFTLTVSPNTLGLAKLTAGLRGGRVAGEATLRRDGGQATLEGDLALGTVPLDLPSLHGEASGKLALAGGGRSPLALVGSLAGSGTATLTDVAIPKADPGALQSVFADIEADALAVDDDMIARALDDAAKRPFLVGTRAFDLSLAGGVLSMAGHGAPASATDKSSEGNSFEADSSTPVTAALDAALDLRTLSLDLRLAETLHALPKDWSGAAPAATLVASGPLDATHRTWDVSALVNTVAARAIARESARIEAYEVDVRERALFNERLQTDRRRDQDKAKVEADRIAAERDAARRAAEARKDAERRAREAAEAQQKAEQPEGHPDGGGGGAGGRAPAPAAGPAPGQQPAQRFDTPRAGASADPSAAGRY